MEITNVNQIFQDKLQEVKSKLPEQTTVNGKFQNLLESAQLAKQPRENTTISETASQSVSNNDDTTKLLAALMQQQSVNSVSSMFPSGQNSANGIFPTSSINSSIISLQQSALIKSLQNKEK